MLVCVCLLYVFETELVEVTWSCWEEREEEEGNIPERTTTSGGATSGDGNEKDMVYESSADCRLSQTGHGVHCAQYCGRPEGPERLDFE